MPAVDARPPEPSSRSIGLRALQAFAILIFLVWSSVFIWRTSFPSPDGRVFCLADDAMISMTYARNLLEGYGLDWSRRGQRVEGFSHPLWLVPMVASGLVGVPLDWRPLCIQFVSLAILLCIPWAVARALTPEGLPRGPAPPGTPASDLGPDSRPRSSLVFASSFLILAYYPILYWSLMGMEAAAQAVILLAACGYALRLARGSAARRDCLLLGALLAAGLLLRMDMAIVLGTAAGGALLLYRRVPRGREALQVLALPVLALVALFVWRHFYFHDLLPNTYYLKLTGIPLDVRLRRGAFTLWEFLGASPVFMATAGALGLLAAIRSLPARLLLLCCLAAWTYDVWVGGDIWEASDILRANRFLIVGVPPLLCAMALGLWRLRLALAGRVSAAIPFALSVIFLAGLSNGLFGARSGQALRRVLLLDPPAQVEDNRQVFEAVEALRPVLLPRATIAVVWAGIPAYFSDYKLVDVLGYNDRRVARMAAVTPFDKTNYVMYRPGHEKWDWAYVVRRFRPDLIFQAWPPGSDALPEWRRLLESYGYREIGGLLVWPESKNLERRWRRAAERADRRRERALPQSSRTSTDRM